MDKRLDKLWWVDFVEGDLNEADLKQVEMILKNSETDQLIVANLERLRQLLKNNDSIEVPVKEEYYDDLACRIMNQVEGIATDGDSNDKTILELSLAGK